MGDLCTSMTAPPGLIDTEGCTPVSYVLLVVKAIVRALVRDSLPYPSPDGYSLPVLRARLFELLGLPASATAGEIKVRYRELARRFHPDVNDDERAHARFRAIAAAYQELLAVDAASSAPEVDRVATAGGDPAGCADPGAPGDGLDRRRAELRTRLVRCKRSFRRAEADARDGAAKAAAARARGNESMAWHFERRAQADQSRALGLVSEIAGVEQELEALTPAGPNPAAPARN